ncbi:hypothetical protein [Clostridium akagii]|uniref:hypothetical protein n=1 Tax=Clostridium akagii TaxID=91623 RepID=UPI00047ECDFE|nr:hypothetical protein [Clostridium akagii]
MIAEIGTQVLPIITNSIISILGIIIAVICSYIINFIKLKNNQIIKDIGVSQYNSDKTLALDIWNIVEEYFRVNQSIENLIENKIKLFNNELKKKCPYLTQEQIDFLRQSIAGEFNKCKSQI